MSAIYANVDAGIPPKMNKGQAKGKQKPALPPKPAKVQPDFGSFVLGMMDYLPKTVSKCFGCRRKVKPRNKQPPPPHNLLIVSFGERPYFNKSNRECSKPANIYFHLNRKCVQVFDGTFSPRQVQVPADLRPHLTQEHIEYLLQQKVQID